jgi:hypothetical protein
MIFSKDRALQLQAVLDSFFLNCEEARIADIVVLYKVTNRHHLQQYRTLKGMFKEVTFIEETDLVEQLIGVAAKNEYILLLVDDTMFTGPFSLSEILTTLRGNNNALGFSLRLGLNTTYCYNHKSNQRIPVFQQINDKIIKYRWIEEQFDFAYPLEVSSSVYRVKDIVPIWLRTIGVTVPYMVNRVEDIMNKSRGEFTETLPYLLCYKQSVAFSNPMNEVSSLPENWVIPVWGDKRFSVDSLMKAFDLGYRLDVKELVGFVSNSCHQEVELKFVK